MRCFWGRASLLCVRGERIKATVVDASPAVQVLNSFQQRGHKSGRFRPPLKEVFIGSALGFHWVKYINLANLHVPISQSVGGIKLS